VIANLGAIPLDSVTYRNDLGAEFCPPDILVSEPPATELMFYH